MDLQVCICPSLENILCVHLFVVPECHSAGYWNGVREKGDFFSPCCPLKHTDKLYKVSKSRVATGAIRSWVHIGTTSFLSLVLFLLFNLTSSYYFPGINISRYTFLSHIFSPHNQLDARPGRTRH